MVTRLAGGATSGASDGTGSAALFWNPCGVTVSSAGVVFVVEKNNHLIRMISSSGTIIAVMICCVSIVVT